jgi:ectoine hydroxylase-related dioxygenase (phytanoyl-CoA dioxygenase family)
MKWQLSMTCANVISPGESRQFIHHDKSHYTYALPEELEPELATIWALQDFTAENGATLLVPGSHAWDRARRDKLFGTDLGLESPLVMQAVMPKGSCLVYSSSTLHAGGDNTSSDDVRWGLRLAYNLAFLRQEENQYMSVPSDVARELPDALQALLGYDTLGALGYVEGAKHPKAVLDASWGARAEGWDPRQVESAVRLPGPDWIMSGGPQPPLFPESAEQQVARKKRTRAVALATAKARRSAM